MPTDAAQAKTAELLGALDVLADAQITHWVCNGTLLGLVRDGELIPWDDDVDIAVVGDTPKPLIVGTMANAGFRLIDDGGTTDYVTFDRNGVRVDINLFKARGELLESIWRVPRSTRTGELAKRVLTIFRMEPGFVARVLPAGSSLWALEGYAVRIDDTYPLGSIEALGRAIPAPRDVPATLAYIYGEDWQTPNRDFNWRVDGANNARGSF